MSEKLKKKSHLLSRRFLAFARRRSYNFPSRFLVRDAASSHGCEEKHFPSKLKRRIARRRRDEGIAASLAKSYRTENFSVRKRASGAATHRYFVNYPALENFHG